MSIEVSLSTQKCGEIKRFLERYYDKQIYMDDDVDRWVYVYDKPLEAVDIISALVDNNDKFQISVCISLDKGIVHTVTSDNCNDIIKDMFYLFYKDTHEYEY